MDSQGPRKRSRRSTNGRENGSAPTPSTIGSDHEKQTRPSLFAQATRVTLLASWFCLCSTTIFVTQLLGSWLYWVNKDYYYAWMALTKQSFGILATTVTQWFSPTAVRVSGGKSVEGQLKLTKHGSLETNFPERLVLIANHQLYPEWVYLWWIAYTSRMHGHLYIILKETLKYIPILGQGMMFYGFIFLARNWKKDQSRMSHRLKQLKTRHTGPMSGSQILDPMWLLIFPEGTNLSPNTRKRSAEWAKNVNREDFKNLLIPRTTGLHHSLTELQGTVDWVYDCTLGYEDVPDGEYAETFYSLRSTYGHGRPPRVNMYWRRFAMSSIPLGNPELFQAWLSKVWQEKESLLDYFKKHGRFPAYGVAVTGETSASGSVVNPSRKGGYIETEVKLSVWFEVGQIFVVLAALALLVNVIARTITLVLRGLSL